MTRLQTKKKHIETKRSTLKRVYYANAKRGWRQKDTFEFSFREASIISYSLEILMFCLC